MSSKKLDETSGVGASMGMGAAWGTKRRQKNEMRVNMKVDRNRAVVYPPKRKHSGGGFTPKKLPYKTGILEKKSERALREAIRNLVFLNRVKYHEEQVRRELQEQKIRKIVRYLLNEANRSMPIQTTTGENNALNFLNNIKVTTFDQLYAQLASEDDQRKSFKATYKEKVKLYLDALDQQHLILNPEEKANYEKQQSGNVSALPPEEPAQPEMPPEQVEPPEEPANLSEADAGGTPVGGATLSNLKTVSDTSHIQSQVIVAQLSKSDLHPTGIEQAKNALKKDLPQIDALYNILTFRPLQLPGVNGAPGEITSDRGAFRKMLVGAMPNSGAPGAQLEKDNLDNFFADVDNNVVTSDKKGGTNSVPAEPTEPAQLSPQTGEPSAGLGGEAPEPGSDEEIEPV